MTALDDADWSPGPKYRNLLTEASDLLADERRTVRDVYYALESHGYGYDYRQVKRALVKGRRAGFIDPTRVMDTSRPTTTVPNEGYDSPATFVHDVIDGIADTYTRNYWDEQPGYVEVWLEKAALASVFDPICRRWNVRLEATRGDWSDSKIYAATQRLHDAVSEGKDVTVLYFGDYNPSGYHAPVAVQNTMQAYGLPLGREGVDSSEPAYFVADRAPVEYVATDGGDEAVGTFAFDRIAMNTDHVERFDLPENPTPSSSDKDRTIRERFIRYVSGGRDVNIELNALKEFHREFLEEYVEDAIREHVDEDAKARVDEQIRKERKAIEQALSVDETMLGR